MTTTKIMATVAVVVCVVLGLTGGVSMGGVIFSVDHNALPDVGDPVITWGDFTRGAGSPYVEDLGGEKWYRNVHIPFDDPGWRMDMMRHNSGNHAPGANIPINGATIVTAVKHTRIPGAPGAPWNSIVDVFYDQLCMGIDNITGRVKVKVSGANGGNPTWTSAADKVIPEEPGVLSLSVDNAANFEVFWRGENDAVAVSMGTGTGNTAGQPYTALYPQANGRGYAGYMNLGRNNPDRWPTYNGLIGDTIVYDEQLSPAALLTVQDQIREAMGIGGGGQPTCWSDDFESYTPGNANGQGPWVDFGGSLPTEISTAQANSPTQSLALSLNPDPAADSSYGSDVYNAALHNGTVLTDGSWTLSYQLLLPSDYEGDLHMYISEGEMPGDFKQGAWLLAKADGDVLQYNFGNSGGTTPLVRDRWAEVKLEIDLDADTFTAYYDGTEFYTGAWNLDGALTPAIGGVNFWADGLTGASGTAYVDDFSLCPTGADGDIPEPVTMAALGLALAGLGGYVRKRRRA